MCRKWKRKGEGKSPTKLVRYLKMLSNPNLVSLILNSSIGQLLESNFETKEASSGNWFWSNWNGGILGPESEILWLFLILILTWVFLYYYIPFLMFYHFLLVSRFSGLKMENINFVVLEETSWILSGIPSTCELLHNFGIHLIYGFPKKML